MKYLVDHERTRELCRIWARGACIETPNYFFWKAGTLDQRSLEGLFKSLLHDVLSRHLDLVSLVFPDEWASSCQLAASNVPVTFNVWTLGKLQRAFRRLLDLSSEDFKLCFFIDGLDEYEGDHEELAQYFSTLSMSPSVKFCISSRPWPIFKEIFDERPQLKLQDLTFEDIQQYVKAVLSNNHRMVSMMNKDPVNSAQLVQSVTKRADGVFLWVILVVKSLLKGLGNRDSITILQRRLEAIPGDLQYLYRHMVQSIDPLYKEEASKLFRILQAFPPDEPRDVELVYRAHSANIESIKSLGSGAFPKSSTQDIDLTGLPSLKKSARIGMARSYGNAISIR